MFSSDRMLLNWARAAWPPVAVLIIHAIFARLGIRKQCDHLLHFLGGFSIAYFLYHGIGVASEYLGSLFLSTRYLLALTASCTVALFWEFGEFGSDQFLHTHIQSSISETIYDLIFGTAGAMVCLLIIRVVQLSRKPSPRS